MYCKRYKRGQFNIIDIRMSNHSSVTKVSKEDPWCNNKNLQYSEQFRKPTPHGQLTSEQGL